MAFLENILKQYGIAADYWPPDEPVPPPEKQADRDASFRDVVLVGADPETELQAAIHEEPGSATSLPLAMRLGDIRAANGQSQAALKAYEFAVLEEDDPVRLCELGYLLLQRCRVDQLPLCDKDFDGSFVDLPGGETVLISSYLIDPDNPGPEFPDQPALLRLAIRAFGLGYARCVQDYFAAEIPADNWWREFLALEGLRVAFMEEDNLDGLEAAIDGFYGEMEGFDNVAPEMPLRDILDPFVGNFREAEGYLRARREAAGLTGGAAADVDRELLKSQHLIVWQLKELLSEVRNKGLTSEEMERLATQISEAVAQKAAESPDVIEMYEHRLAQEFGDRWCQLPTDVQRLVTHAEWLRSLLRPRGEADWNGVVVQYARAAEVLLRRLGERLDAQNVDRRLNNGYPWASAGIETFQRLFGSPQFPQLAALKGISHASLMAQLAPDLETVAKTYRNPAVHGAEPTHPAKARELRALLLGRHGQSALLWKIASLCNAD